jgi:hypothetical protein
MSYQRGDGRPKTNQEENDDDPHSISPCLPDRQDRAGQRTLEPGAWPTSKSYMACISRLQPSVEALDGNGSHPARMPILWRRNAPESFENIGINMYVPNLLVPP